MNRIFKRIVKTSKRGGETTAPLTGQTTFKQPALGDWYSPLLLGPATLGRLATSSLSLRQVIQIVERLAPDDYTRYLLAYYQAGLERFGEAWCYADIATVLLAAAKLIQPQNYLEIGVRRGRSMAMVAATCPTCEIIGLDTWDGDYAGMPNPGPDFVRSEMKKLGHTGRLELITDDSHKRLPYFFAEHPSTFFDLITVDGDHSKKGAAQDLCDVLPRLKIGGVIVFDDMCHPAHPYLANVWKKVVVSNSQFDTWRATELGYGVAFAIKKEI